MHNPHAGGTTIPSAVRQETERRIRAYAEKRYAGAFSRLDIRFHGALCYIDAYVEPDPPSRRLLHVLDETRGQYLDRVRERSMDEIGRILIAQPLWPSAAKSHNESSNKPMHLTAVGYRPLT
jgi:hypothetical protein